MIIHRVSNTANNTSFGMMKFKLSEETLKLISESTKLTVEEMHRLPLSESTRLMKERGALKEPNKFKGWLSNVYTKFGEKTGLLKKEHYFYSEI